MYINLPISCFNIVEEISFSGIRSRSHVSRMSSLQCGLSGSEGMQWTPLLQDEDGDTNLEVLSGEVREDNSSFVSSLVTLREEVLGSDIWLCWAEHNDSSELPFLGLSLQLLLSNRESRGLDLPDPSLWWEGLTQQGVLEVCWGLLVNELPLDSGVLCPLMCEASPSSLDWDSCGIRVLTSSHSSFSFSKFVAAVFGRF